MRKPCHLTADNRIANLRFHRPGAEGANPVNIEAVWADRAVRKYRADTGELCLLHREARLFVDFRIRWRSRH